MIKVKLLITVTLILSSSLVHATEMYIPELNGYLSIIREAAAPDSYDTVLKVSLLNKDKSTKVLYPRMMGPVHLSIINKQLFTCESNAIFATKSAFAYDLSGANVFSFKHIGFVRGCGITDDKRIYWIHYNIVQNNKPTNIFVALSGHGQVLHKESFEKSKYVKFMYNNNHYTVSIPDAEMPG